ncbi:unnamed protein product [Rhodiola kirilowii]
MDRGVAYRSGSRVRFSSSDRLAALGLALLGVFSPLFIDRRQVIVLEEDEALNLGSWLPLLLLILLITITISRCLDRDFTRFDPNWIHRGGWFFSGDYCYSNYSCSSFEAESIHETSSDLIILL